MSVSYLILACVSMTLGWIAIVRYPGKPSPHSEEPNSGVVMFGAAVVGMIAGFTRPDVTQPVNGVATIAAAITIITMIIVWQLRDRRARRAAAAGGETSPTAPEPTDGDGPK